MTTKPRRPVRWSGYLLLAGLLCAVSAGLVAAGAIEPGWAAAAAVCGAAFIVATGALQIARLRHAKMSAEITVLSERLLRLEAQASDGRAGQAAIDRTLSSGMATDIEVLSRLVGEVAEALSEQGRAIAALKSRLVDTESPSRPTEDEPTAPAAEPARPSDPAAGLSSREDFARAASAILHRLGSGAPADRAETPASTIRDRPGDSAGPAEHVVLAALAQGRLELHLQAAVTLPQRRTRFYEALSRLRLPGDELLMPGDLLPVLRRHGRVADLDALAVRRAFAVARHLSARDSDASVSCNVARASLADGHFLKAWDVTAATDPEAARRLIFEVAELGALTEDETAGAARLRASGAVLALDHIAELDQDWLALARRGVRFAKVEVDALFAARHGPGLAEFVQTLARTGIQLVATRVEEEGRIPDLLDYDVPLAQGFALAMPRPVRADVTTRPPDAPPTAAGGPAAPAPGAIPFREFLRRAG